MAAIKAGPKCAIHKPGEKTHAEVSDNDYGCDMHLPNTYAEPFVQRPRPFVA